MFRRSKPVTGAIDVRDGDSRELLVCHTRKATDVDAVHLSDRRFRSHAKATDAAAVAEEVQVLAGVEPVLRQLRLARQKAKVLGRCDRGPKSGSAADGAVAAIGALREIDVSLELNCSAMATAGVGLEHVEYWGRRTRGV